MKRSIFALPIVLLSFVALGCSTTQMVPVGGGTGAGPWVDSLSASPGTIVTKGSSIQITVDAAPRVEGPLTYSWSASGGAIDGSGASATWVAPNTSGGYTVAVAVSESGQPDTTASVDIRVKTSIRLP